MNRESDNSAILEENWLEIPYDLGAGNPARVPDRQQSDLWALVLEARSIPCRMGRHEGAWRVFVPADRIGEALRELRLFEEENRNWPPSTPPSNPLAENTLATVSVLLLLATFHNITQLGIPLTGNSPVDWPALGSADSARILGGQWWRTITALTLHADWLHLSGNLAIGGIFIVFLCRDLGSGLAWTLLLGSGVLGNLANAFLHAGNHNSIGASTTVFGAVGILAAITMMRHRNHPRKRWALPIAAALGLLALLGTEGENTDLGAHLFGFVFGVGLGLVAEYLVGRYGRPGRGLNVLLSLSSAALMVSAWLAALAFTP